MRKYIDGGKLIANLKRQKHELELSIQSGGDYGQSCQIIAYDNILATIVSLQQEQPEVDKYDCPITPIEEAIEVTSRMQYIDEEMKPIAKFIMDYASWNLHKDEWNQPVIEVPLFRVLDALIQKGKPYCDAG